MPGHGSEAAIGWGWVRSLAEAGHDVTVVTRVVGHEERSRWLASAPDLDLSLVHVEDHPLAAWARRRLGIAGKVLAYVAWQRAALRRARALHADRSFEIVHHVNFGSMTLGSPMWRLGVPFVFGPVGGGQVAPPAARRLFGGAWAGERLRSAMVRMMRTNPLARSAVRRADVVLAINRDTEDLALALGARRTRLMCDTGIHEDVRRRAARRAEDGGRSAGGDRLRVVWIGRIMPRKALALAVDAFARVAPDVEADLHVIGDGPLAGEVRRQVAERGLGDRVVMHGQVPWDDALGIVAAADVMLFTSLRESLGSQVVEAAALGVPLVALDLHGVASLFPPDGAVKVPFTTPATTAADLAAALHRVLRDPDLRASLARGARRFAEEERWPSRARRMTSVYREVLGGGPGADLRGDAHRVLAG